MARPVVFIAGKDPIAEVSGGHSSYVRAHARAAAGAGFEPHLFCVSDRNERSAADFGVIHRIKSPFRPFRQLMVLAHGPLIASAVERFLLAMKGRSLIHSFGVWGYAGILASQRVASRGITAIPVLSSYDVYRHELLSKTTRATSAYGYVERLRYKSQYLWARLFVEHCERRAYLESRRIMVNYDSIRQLVIGRFGPGVRIVKVPYSSESAFLDGHWNGQSTRSGNEGALHISPIPLIVAISRHEPNKGIDLLLLSLAELREAGVSFRACLVGGGSLFSVHREMAQRLHLSDIVEITGVVPNAVQYLNGADIFVLPSLREASGSLAMIEALQAGLAVVVSNVDGIPEDVVDGTNALLVEPGSVSELSRAIHRVLTDVTLRERLGRAARETFVERFSAGSFVAGIKQQYAELGFVPEA